MIATTVDRVNTQSAEGRDRMRMYYAHAKPSYGTLTERAEQGQIKTRFAEYEIIDPGKYEGNVEKQRMGGLNYCFQLIDGCQALTYSRWKNKITAGVGKEINYALSKNMPVYELRGKRVKAIHRPVTYLSLDATMRLYSALELKQRQRKAVKTQ